MPKTLVGEQPFCAVFQKISGSEKFFKKRGKEYQEFQSKVFCLKVPESLVGEQPFCAVFQNFSGSEKVLKNWGRVLKVSVESFLSHSGEYFGRETTLPFCAVFQRHSGSDKVLKKRGKE